MPAAPFPASMSTVLLVRHGETTWNRDRRIQGWAPSSLTDRGREQAAAVAAHLAAGGVDRVVASDLRRAKETARAVTGATGAPATFDPGWRERGFGVYQGLPYDDLFSGHPEFAFGESGYAAAEVVPEGGESVLEARERVLDAWARLLADLGDGETVAVVAHGGPIRLVVGHLRGWDVVRSVLDVETPNCSVTEVAVRSDPELVSVGEVVGKGGTDQGGLY